MMDPTQDERDPQIGFADAIADLAMAEADAVVADLARVNFRADQVLRVLKALNLPVPDALASYGAAAQASPPRDPEADDIGGAMGAPSAEPVQAETPAPEPSDTPPVFDATDPLKVNTVKGDKPKRGHGDGGKAALGARNRDEIVAFLNTNGPALATEIADNVTADISAVRGHLRRLLDEGRIHLTGERRRDARDKRRAGMMPVVYAAGASPGKLPPAEAPAKPAETPEAPIDEDGLQDIVNRVRATMIRFAGDKMPIGQIAELAGVSKIAATAVMEQLASTGAVKKSRPPGSKEDLYVYTAAVAVGSLTTDGPGKPKTATNGTGTLTGPRVVKEPVAGTGRPKTAGNQAVRDLIAKARRAGARVEPSGSGHWAVFCPKGRILIPSTPSGDKSLRAAETRLKNAGLAIK
jgi:DNA-binding transcriptional ArsR family regulator